MCKSFVCVLMMLCLSIPAISIADVKADSYENDPDITAPSAPQEPITQQRQSEVPPLEIRAMKEKRFSFIALTNRDIAVLTFTAVTDQITINEVVVNRGNRVYTHEHRKLPITLGFGETLVLKDATRERAEIAVIEKHKNTNYARQNEREQAVSWKIGTSRLTMRSQKRSLYTPILVLMSSNSKGCLPQS